MQGLIKKIKGLRKTGIKRLVNYRIKEFGANRTKPTNQLFSELCLCILTANFSAERAIKIQEAVGNGFCTLSKKQLAKRLKLLGHRHPNARADYIVEARKCKPLLKDKINSLPENELREWLANTIKGLGYKEASHLLRNIGFRNSAVIDFHIIDLLVKYRIIKPLKTLTKKKYLEIEKILRKLGRKLDMNLAELDLYLWFMETGKVLK